MSAERRRIIQAVGRLGRRVTAADVVHETGEPLHLVQKELNWLASQTECALEVSKTGAVVYAFSNHFARKILLDTFARRVLWLPARFWRTAKYLFRISFGIDLIVSLTVSAILVLIVMLRFLDGGLDLNWGGGGGKGKKAKKSRKKKKSIDLPVAKESPPKTIEVKDEKLAGPVRPSAAKQGYFNECFLYLFGESDPNRDLMARQWAGIAGLIEQNEGVVTFEQIEPWLATPTTPAQRERAVFNVLARYDGRPEVTEQGDIVYVFPSLKDTAIQANVEDDAPAESCLTEYRWDHGQHGMVPVLVWVNLVLCVIVLFAMPLAGVFLMPNALAFVLVPLFTKFRLAQANAEIARRNGQRKVLADKLSSPENKGKLEAAKEYAEKAISVSQKDVVYSSGRDLLEQEIERGLERASEAAGERRIEMAGNDLSGGKIELEKEPIVAQPQELQ